MVEIEKKTKRYPTDLTDEEWARIEPFLPGAAKSGRPARTTLGRVLSETRQRAGEELIMRTFSFVIFAALTFWPLTASAQLNVLISGGFAYAMEVYPEEIDSLLRDFKKFKHIYPNFSGPYPTAEEAMQVAKSRKITY